MTVSVIVSGFENPALGLGSLPIQITDLGDVRTCTTCGSLSRRLFFIVNCKHSVCDRCICLDDKGLCFCKSCGKCEAIAEQLIHHEDKVLPIKSVCNCGYESTLGEIKKHILACPSYVRELRNTEAASSTSLQDTIKEMKDAILSLKMDQSAARKMVAAPAMIKEPEGESVPEGSQDKDLLRFRHDATLNSVMLEVKTFQRTLLTEVAEHTNRLLKEVKTETFKHLQAMMQKLKPEDTLESLIAEVRVFEESLDKTIKLSSFKILEDLKFETTESIKATLENMEKQLPLLSEKQDSAIKRLDEQIDNVKVALKAQLEGNKALTRRIKQVDTRYVLLTGFRQFVKASKGQQTKEYQSGVFYCGGYNWKIVCNFEVVVEGDVVDGNHTSRPANGAEEAQLIVNVVPQPRNDTVILPGFFPINKKISLYVHIGDHSWNSHVLTMHNDELISPAFVVPDGVKGTSMHSTLTYSAIKAALSASKKDDVPVKFTVEDP